jgi:NADH-quinone oxidoreductase subunit G
MEADRTLHEPKPPEDTDSALSYTMEGAAAEVPPALHPVEWAPRWNSHQQATAKFQDEVGGPLRGGDPGVRLIEPAAEPAARWFDPPPATVREPGSWRAVPLYHIFGGEELSALSAPIAERAPVPYAALHPDDLAALNGAEAVDLNLGTRTLRLPARAEPSLPPGTVGLPVDLPGVLLADLPDRVGLAPAGENE